MTTHLFLDVDGVFNAFGNQYFKDKDLWGDLTTVNVNRFPITFSATLVARINALAERDDVEVYWLTTWAEDAANDLSPALGINGKEWPVAGRPPFREKDGVWWKLTAIRGYVEDVIPAGDQVVWVDDDFIVDTEAKEWWQESLAAGQKMLCISPQTHLGITPDEMEKIETFVETGSADG